MAAVLAFALGAHGCGGAPAPPAASPVAEDWPSLTPWPLEVATVEDVASAADGAPVRLRAFLVAIKLPCPPCNIGTHRPPREEIAGHTSRPRGPAPPGCLPCPDPAATLSDESPNSPEARGNARVRLRAVGVAGALQPRHVGHSFLFIGVFHANGPNGPELDVTDVRALDAH